ncbi:cytochrome c family protein [Carboxylicivirga marina]|uniref:Cytochrome c domain-containing protein n=1 Tax=Carboxylicivirga marina TaxID=2800988 RepID=A0ABS1HQH2_9BACT|nr:hypothetical protein [Carboxylicivirga marina]MBK3519921.1 hypothetical protein [Carboxylicivirga marina]
MKKITFLFVVSLFSFACSNSSDDEIMRDDNEAYKAAETFYNNTLKSVITTNCISCHAGYHSKDNSSNYGNLTNAINNASGMYNQVNSGNMPLDGDKLSQDDIDKFEDFMDLVNAIP